MPQMELVPFKNPSNVDILNAIRGVTTSDYQNRVPAATQANVNTSIESMWNYSPARNQFVDALANLIGGQILKYNTWTNRLAKFKRGMLNYGETIEEVAIGLLTAKSYNPDAEYLEKEIFGRETNEVQSRWHRINRQDRYKVTINRNLLRRAFENNGGLSAFITGLMEQIATSDNWDEFLITTSLFRQYYDQNGFYKVRIPDISNINATNNDAKQALRQMRTLADTLPFMARDYNAAKMPMAAKPEQLELFITPEAQATIDVEGLAAAFNVSKAEFSTRTTILPEKYVNIPNFQGLLTTREFFIIADQFMDSETINNPAGIYQNYWWHHHELISASPFVPAVLFSSEEESAIVVIDYAITGISALTVTDLITQVAVTDGTVSRGEGYLIAGTATTEPAGGPNTALNLSIVGAQSGRTRISQEGVLIVGYDEPATSITVHAESTSDNTFEKDLVLTVTGALVEGSIGQTVDDNTAVISNTALPVITPTSGAVGTVFTVDNGKWDTKGLTYAIQWQADGTNVASGGTGTTYTAVAGDAGKTLTATVTASKTGLTSGTATSKGATVTA